MIRRSILALALLAGLLAPASAEQASLSAPGFVPRNFKAGFTLSVDAATPNSVVDVGPGAAADSTNAALLSNPSAGTVNLASTGAGGVDTGAVAASTPYAIFEISGSAGVAAIASSPAPIRSTGAIASGSTTLGTASGTNVTAGSNISVQGAGPGGTTLNTTVSAASPVSVSPTGTTVASSNSITSVSSIASVIPGLAISDGTCIQAGTVIAAASGSTITLSQNTASSGCGTGQTLTITGENVTLANAASTSVGGTGGTTANRTVAVWGVGSISGRVPLSPLLPSGYSYYRYIGTVRTDGSSHILPFTQRGDMVTFAAAINDVNSVTLAGAPAINMITLSVPVGVNVRPLLRVSAGNNAGLAIVSPDEPTSVAGITLDFAFSTVGPGPDLRTSSAGQVDLLATTSDPATVIWTRGYIEDFGRSN